LDRLYRSRFRSQVVDAIRNGSSKGRQKRRRRAGARDDFAVVKGVRDGRFFRVKVPAGAGRVGGSRAAAASPGLLLPPPQWPFLRVAGGGGGVLASRRRLMNKWFLENWPAMVLNFGAVCTLIGFTRSDVLELRSFSVTGSICNVVYQATLQPVRLISVAWSSLFALVNSWNIYHILLERNSTVRLTQQEEDIYVKHFMPHGITPKQFESIWKEAEIARYEKGSAIIKQGERQQHVCLVIRGHTRANILGRRISAASFRHDGSAPDDESDDEVVEESRYGASGAWIGEMSFLEQYWAKEQAKIHPKKTNAAPGSEKKKATDPESKQQQIATKGEKNEAPKGTISETRGGEIAAPAVAAASDAAGGKVDDKSSAVSIQQKKTFVGSSKLASASSKMEKSLYTIVAADDCTILRWSHGTMEQLMARSTDMRSAMTRAMTAAVVGKVIHFTVSRSQALPTTWSTWLDDWKHSAGATIEVEEVAKDVASNGTEEAVVEEILPSFDIKDFS